jgi:hypothetical protein
VLKAALAACDLLITPDTGPMHVAAAVGTPIVALFWAAAHPEETGPYGPGHMVLQPQLACAPCQPGTQCPHEICRTVIRPAHVLRAAQLTLAQAGHILSLVTQPLESEDESRPGSVRFRTTGAEPWHGPQTLQSLQTTPAQAVLARAH